MRLSRYDDGPIRRLHGHVRAELERNPYAEGTQARYAERRRALGLAHPERPISSDSDQTVHAVVIDARYAGGPVSLVVTRMGCTLEFENGESIASRTATLEPMMGILFDLGAEILTTLTPARGTAFPDVECANLWVRTTRGLFVAGGPMELLATDESELAVLYRMGVRVMASLLEGEA